MRFETISGFIERCTWCYDINEVSAKGSCRCHLCKSGTKPNDEHSKCIPDPDSAPSEPAPEPEPEPAPAPEPEPELLTSRP